MAQQSKSTTKSTSGNGRKSAASSTGTDTTSSRAAKSPAAETFSAKAHEVVSKLSEQLATAEEKLRATASSTQVEARHKAREAKVKKDEFLTEASAYVREKPLHALGIAALGGALLGIFLKRR